MNGSREEDEAVVIKNDICSRCNKKIPKPFPHRCPNCKTILILETNIDPIKAAFETIVVPNIRNLLN